MEWIFLFFAGLLEVFWSTCLKLSEGFSVLKFSVLTIIGMVFSFLFLAVSLDFPYLFRLNFYLFILLSTSNINISVTSVLCYKI